MDDLENCYRILELEPGASLEDINQAYKDLAFVWHPDRIPADNPRLLQKAVSKLKSLNYARDRLRAHKPHRHHAKREAAASPQYYRSAHHYAYTRHPKTPPAQPATPVERPPVDNSNSPQSNFQGANLREKDLSGRNLRGADLRGADLSDSFLHNVILEAANLSKANLFRANLLQANLRRANLQEANLIGADLSGADLREADLRGARISKGEKILVKLTGANLMGAILPDGSIYD